MLSTGAVSVKHVKYATHGCSEATTQLVPFIFLSAAHLSAK